MKNINVQNVASTYESRFLREALVEPDLTPSELTLVLGLTIELKSKHSVVN